MPWSSVEGWGTYLRQAWSIGLGSCGSGRSRWRGPCRGCLAQLHCQSLWRWRGRRCEDQRSKGLSQKDHCVRAAWWTFAVGRATTMGQLFSQAIWLSIVTVLSSLACPGGVFILTRFPALLWESQQLSVPCRAGLCLIYPTAWLLGFLPDCVRMRSGCMLWKEVHACWPGQCCHILPEVCLFGREDETHRWKPGGLQCRCGELKTRL